MADNLGISEAQLLGLFLESVFWGMFLITFFQCIRYLLWDSKMNFKSLKTINWPMLIVALLLAFFATFDVALGLMHSIEAFIFYTGPGGSDERFTGLTDWVNILKTCNVIFGKLISDAVLVYRCWVIYNRNWLIVSFPILLVLGYFGTALFALWLEVSADKPSVLLTGGLKQLTPSITAQWSMSIVANILATGLIVWRIWRVDRENARYAIHTTSDGSRGNRSIFSRKRTRLQNVTRIIIESGLMYTTVALVTFIVFEAGSTAFYATSDAELQILSIAFNLIIIRISSRPAEDYTIKTSSSGGQHMFKMKHFPTGTTTTSDGVILTSVNDIGIPSSKRTLDTPRTDASFLDVGVDSDDKDAAHVQRDSQGGLGYADDVGSAV